MDHAAQSGVVKVSLVANRRFIAAGQEQIVYLLVEMKAREKEKDTSGTSRLPLNLGLVLDRSGSMAGDKLAYTRKAASFVVNHLSEKDYVSVVAFDDEVNVLLPSRHVANKDALKQILDQIGPGGSTNLSGGLISGFREVKRQARPNQVNRILLLTDGLANVGLTGPALIDKAGEIRRAGVGVTTLGVGSDFDEDLLLAMAEKSAGNFYFIENPDRIPAIFAEELQGLLQVVAQGISLRFRPWAGWRLAGVFGYPPDVTPAGVFFDIPDMYRGEAKFLLFELLSPRVASGIHQAGEISIQYEDAVSGGSVSLSLQLEMEATDDPVLLREPENPEVLRRREEFRASEALERAKEAADAGQFDEAGNILSEQARSLSALAETTGDADLKARAERLSMQAEKMRSSAFDKTVRKQVVNESYMLRRSR